MTFLVSQQHKAVVFNPPDAQRVFSLIPTAKPFEYKGTTLVAMPFRLDETRVLRNIGLPLPSPVGYFYDWPHDKALISQIMPLQKETTGFLTLNPRAYCLNGIGTGKTVSTSWAADFMMKEQTVRRVLIICTLSTMEDAWANTIFHHFRHRTSRVLYGSAAKRRKLFAQDADFYIVNFDGLETILDVKRDKHGKVIGATLLRDDIDLVIIDEGSYYRNANTDRYTAVRHAIKPTMAVWDLTATPTPQWPSDAWGQCRLITPHTVPPYFTAFKNMVMQQLTQYKWVPRENAMDIVYQAMQPSIRFSRQEVFKDLPGDVRETRSVELTSAQKKHYKELMDELSTELSTGAQVLAANEGVKMMKLVQTACGVMYDRQGNHHEVDCKPRMDVVMEIIEQCDEKVIVFAPLEGVVQMLHREISKRWSCELVHGSTSKASRDRIFSDFQKSSEPRVLVAHPGCMAHGLTLTEASTIVWYAPITSNEIYNQANGRITRPGQKTVALIVNIAATELERRMYKSLETKTALQGILLDMVQNRGEV
jgi:SNF2 family DNA or RNA helicase